MSGVNISGETDAMLLQRLNAEKTLEYAPTLAFVTFVIVFGIVGNSMTVWFYGFIVKKTIASFLLAVLSLNDLMAIIVFVDQLVDLSYMLTFMSHFGCSLMHCVNHTLVTNSYCFLLLVGVDRYLLICCPFSKRKITKSSAKKSVIGLVIFSVIVGVRSFAIFDIVNTDLPINDNKTIIAYRCAHSVSDHMTVYVKVFHLIDVVFAVSIIASLVVLYILIWKTILRTRAYAERSSVKRKSVKGNEITYETSFTNLDLSSTKAGTEIDTRHTIEVNTPIFEESSIESSENKLADTKSNTCTAGYNKIHQNNVSLQAIATDLSLSAKPAKKKKKKKKKQSDKTDTAERLITVTVFAMTAASIISLMPYFIVSFMLGSNSHHFSAAQQVAHRSFILNNAVNPYVIGMVNSEFRLFLWKRFCQCFNRRRK